MTALQKSPQCLRQIHLPLYSSLQRALASAPYAKATYATWYAWLNALTRKGVSAVEWECIPDFFAEFGEENDVVSVDDLRQWFTRDDPAVVEIFLREIVVYPSLSFFSFTRDIPAGDKPWNHPSQPQSCWHYYNPVHDFRIVSQRNHSVMGFSEDWMVLNRHWQLWRYKKIVSPYFVSGSEAKRWCDRVVKELMPIKRGVRQPSQEWSKYITEGGTHYREWLITLPKHSPIFDAAEENTHFDVDNVIVHLRTTDRQLDGKSVLFIEEVQSDWNQMVRHGDADIRALYDNPYRTQWVALALRVALLIAAQENKSGIALATGEMNEARYADDNPGLVHFYNHIVTADLKRLAKALGASLHYLPIAFQDAICDVPSLLLSTPLCERLLQQGLPRLGAVQYE